MELKCIFYEGDVVNFFGFWDIWESLGSFGVFFVVFECLGYSGCDILVSESFLEIVVVGFIN